ncbi:MAG TPA: hypothetical protein VKC61_14845 [Pyrinomonadaceae bacterium]|nr:hypothetical protein [Pyrinomonadaceae bacterium]
MNRNAKIALGCGGAGCLGLIVVVIVAVVLVLTGVVKAPGIYNPNSNSNHNYNFNRNSNSNSNANANDNANENSDSSTSSSSMSSDDKHKLLMAASFANDTEMMQRVMRKLGFVTDSGVAPDYAQFLQEHAEWAHRNQEFINSVNTQESARAYLNAHIDD